MIIPATVVIGVGGQGSSIALRVKQRLLDYAAERQQAERERQYIEKYVRVFSVDTKNEQAIHGQLSAESEWILQPGGAVQAVRNIQGPERPGTPPNFLREWWPKNIRTPGDFLAGAGAVRAKGRLAYYLQGQGIAANIAEAITGLRNVRDADPLAQGDAQPVYVIIAGSLSGGTGSGILLTLAMHIRKLVTGNVKIIGAIPLASVMEMAPSDMLRQSVRANCSAALRELEWFQTPPDLRVGQITPFFKLGAEAIVGDGTDGALLPFDLCFVYTRGNRNGLVLKDHADYTQLVADCLALDINSPVSDGSKSRLSNFIQAATVQVRPPDGTKECKPVVFASSGAAALEYPVRNVSEYLGLQLFGRVLDTYFLSPVDLHDEAAKWVSANRLEERGRLQNPLHEDLKKPWRDTVTGEALRVGAAPGIPGVEAANGRNVRKLVMDARKNLDERWLPTLETLLKRNYEPLLENHRASIWNALLAELGQENGQGFARTLRFASSLRAVLQVNLDDVDQEINAADAGRLATLERLDSALKDRPKSAVVKGALQDLEQALSGFQIIGQRARDARIRFMDKWWKPYADNRENIVVGQAVIHLYRELIGWLDGLIAMLEDVESQIKRYRHTIDVETASALGQRGMLVLEERVLDHPVLVNELFKDKLARQAEAGSHASVALASSVLRGTPGLIGLLTDLNSQSVPTLEQRRRRIQATVTAMLESARESAALVFWDEVSGLSLWDALEREALLRRDLPASMNMEDETIRAMRAGSLPDTDQEFVERYIATRVQKTVNMALPFWYLNSVALQEDGARFPVHTDGSIDYSLASFSDENDPRREQLRRLVSGIAARQGWAANESTAPSYRLVATTRELGAPLFMLNRGELTELREAEQQLQTAYGPVYVDQRFVGVLPDDFELDSLQKLARDHREARALVMGMHFGYLRYSVSATGKVNRNVVQVTSELKEPRWRKFASGIADALTLLQVNDTSVCELEELLRSAWQTVPERDRATELNKARRWVLDELDRVPASSDQGSPRRKALELMLEAVDESVAPGA